MKSIRLSGKIFLQMLIIILGICFVGSYVWKAYPPAVNERLMRAVQKGELAKVRLLLALKADANAPVHSNGRPMGTPFFRAINQAAAQRDGVIQNMPERHEILELLLKQGADVDAVNPQGKTPLLIAIDRANEELANLLLRNGAEINARDILPLNWAILSGNIDMVEILLANGADINAKNQHSLSPLELARSLQLEDVEFTAVDLQKIRERIEMDVQE